MARSIPCWMLLASRKFAGIVQNARDSVGPNDQKSVKLKATFMFRRISAREWILIPRSRRRADPKRLRILGNLMVRSPSSSFAGFLVMKERLPDS